MWIFLAKKRGGKVQKRESLMTQHHVESFVEPKRIMHGQRARNGHMWLWANDGLNKKVTHCTPSFQLTEIDIYLLPVLFFSQTFCRYIKTWFRYTVEYIYHVQHFEEYSLLAKSQHSHSLLSYIVNVISDTYRYFPYKVFLSSIMVSLNFLLKSSSSDFCPCHANRFIKGLYHYVISWSTFSL